MKKYETYAGYIFSWLFGLLFLLTGVLNYTFSPLPSATLLILGVLLLPPINMYLNKALDLKLTNRARVVFLLLFIALGILAIASMCGWFYCDVNVT